MPRPDDYERYDMCKNRPLPKLCKFVVDCACNAGIAPGAICCDIEFKSCEEKAVGNAWEETKCIARYQSCVGRGTQLK